jgi:hypothetical protein
VFGRSLKAWAECIGADVRDTLAILVTSWSVGHRTLVVSQAGQSRDQNTAVSAIAIIFAGHRLTASPVIFVVRQPRSPRPPRAGIANGLSGGLYYRMNDISIVICSSARSEYMSSLPTNEIRPSRIYRKAFVSTFAAREH